MPRRRRAGPPPRALIRACSGLYRECVSASGAADKAIARAFRADRRLDADARAFVADTVQGMLRARGFVEAAIARLPGAREEDAVLLFLLARRGVPAGTRDAVLAPAIAAAEKDTGGVDAKLPDWLRKALPGGADLLRTLAKEPPVTLRTNTLRISRRELQQGLFDEGVDTRPTRFSPWGLTLERRANVFRTRGFREGFFEMQDEASQLAALLCAPKPGDVAVDGCAGAGGKTLALAALMRNKGTLYAFDTAAFRLEALRERAARAGVHNLRVHAVKENDLRPLARLNGKAAVVLVDAPCSGTGVLRRNPDIGWKLCEADVANLAAEQAHLLDVHAPLVKPGGRLVYAVCSLLPVEREERVERFLRDHPDFRRVDAGAVFRVAGVKGEGLVVRGDFHADPVRHEMDGFYAAVLERTSALA
ncbi:MAG: RsmB/NOP family class I SAM-dependent RNA methyltransferase [Planctomycetes bacterium]|nr:RsmB/NOP family class I SAM-dependent RNA methyltransferase [Planctomycetota bacterium]